MLKLKLQYVGHLMQRASSLEKTLMLGKTEGRRRSGQKRMRWLNSNTDSMDMNLSKLPEIVEDREAWCAALHWAAKSPTRLSHVNNKGKRGLKPSRTLQGLPEYKSHHVPCFLFGLPQVPVDFPSSPDSKESACNAGNPGLIPDLGRSLGEGNDNPLQYSCLENSMDRGATVHGVTKRQTRLSN